METLRLISQVVYKAEFGYLCFSAHRGLQKARENFHKGL